jgi:ribosomal protein L11 methyltransferase
MSKDSGSWVEVQVEVPAPVAELLAAALADLAGGVELRDAETIFPTARDRTTVVTLCRPDERDDLLAAVDEVLATARAAGDTVDPVGIRQRPAHEDEWRDVWKQFFRTTRIGARFAVRPSWDPAGVAGVEHIIELDPGRAYGTGAHPSTRLVIGALERLAGAGAGVGRFLDLGCGSGILTIAAHWLWPAAKGWAVDLDPEAADCTRENLVLNGIQDGIEVAAATLEQLGADGRGFDLVMANIQRDVLETLVAGLLEALVPGGHLVLSGLLTADAPPVLASYQQAGLRLIERTDEGEWASLLLQR